MTADELIENAETITAAKFIKANIESCILDDEAEFLFGFKVPLAMVIETIKYRYDLSDKCDLDADFETEDEEETEGIAMQ